MQRRMGSGFAVIGRGAGYSYSRGHCGLLKSPLSTQMVWPVMKAAASPVMGLEGSDNCFGDPLRETPASRPEAPHSGGNEIR